MLLINKYKNLTPTLVYHEISIRVLLDLGWQGSSADQEFFPTSKPLYPRFNFGRLRLPTLKRYYRIQNNQ